MPNKSISSAGIEALVGHNIEKKAASVLEDNGYSFEKHIARQLNHNLISEADLVLVMEKSHQTLIMQKYPEASGKILLFGKWQDNTDIYDPYRKSSEVFGYIFNQIEQSCLDWSSRLAN
jgi:protein-tyrosine phosphatase